MKSLFLALALVLTAGCTKAEKSDPPAADKPPADKPPADEPAVDPATDADYVRVLASHANPKPSDPVTIEIPGFEVTKASFDPQKVEGGTATLELDLASIVSGSDKRDNHLRSADYLDTEKFAIATITVGNVQKAAGATYRADALVSIHGVEKTLPVTFEVLETLPDGIRIRGEHEFARQDFGIGAAEGDSAAPTQKIQLQLTLRNR